MASAKPMVKAAAIIGVVAVVVLISIAIMAQFGKSVRTSTDTNVSIPLPAAANTSVQIGSAGLYPFPQSLTGCINSTCLNGSTGGVDIEPNCTFGTGFYTIDEGTADAGQLILGQAAADQWESSTINCSKLTYLATTAASKVGDSFVTGLQVFGAFIGVLVLGLVGLMLVKVFKKS